MKKTLYISMLFMVLMVALYIASQMRFYKCDGKVIATGVVELYTTRTRLLEITATVPVGTELHLVIDNNGTDSFLDDDFISSYEPF